MLSNIEMNDFSSGMINNEKYIKSLEANSWDGKKNPYPLYVRDDFLKTLSIVVFFSLRYQGHRV